MTWSLVNGAACNVLSVGACVPLSPDFPGFWLVGWKRTGVRRWSTGSLDLRVEWFCCVLDPSFLSTRWPCPIFVIQPLCH